MRTILVAEDHGSVRTLVRVLLEDRGYRVVEAIDGTQVIELAEKRTPDLIILDLMMPGLDGERVIPMIKQSEVLSDIPVIVVTAKMEALDRVGEMIGHENVFTKPFDEDQLLARVSELAGPSGLS